MISRFVEDLKKQPTPEFKPETGEFINKNFRNKYLRFLRFLFLNLNVLMVNELKRQKNA